MEVARTSGREKLKEEHMNAEQEPRWRRVAGRLPVFVAVVALYVLIFVSIIVDDMNRDGKVGLWEWVGVLIIPVALTAGGIWLNNAQIRREETIGNQHAQDEALRVYLNEMSKLVVDDHLRDEHGDPDVRKVAQARTIALLLGLDASRKRRALKLVYELGLIDKIVPILDLKNASLDNADLGELALPDACLSHVDLRTSDLSGSNLRSSDLSKADLRGANLTNADLSGADLVGVNFLPYDKREPAKMSIHNLKDRDIDSREADLRFTKIRPSLTLTNLSNTNLADADLSGAILANTDLRNTRGLTEEQLEQTIGNQRTLLPSSLTSPGVWRKPIEEQIEMRNKPNAESLRTV